MKFLDLSHHNGEIDFEKIKKNSYIDGVILKCTENYNFKDPKFETNKTAARKSGLLCGFYHFARGGNIKKEARFFLDSVGEMQAGEFLALDWEIEHTDPVGWCYDFLDYIYKQTGLYSLLYIQESRVRRFNWKIVVDHGFGLWIAKYGSNNGARQTAPQLGDWKYFTFWQYTSRGKIDGVSGYVDLNYSSFSLSQIMQIGKKSNQATLIPEQKKEELKIDPQKYEKYTIQRGDTLWDISKHRYGNGNDWHIIYDANRAVLGLYPSKIKPGTEIIIPKKKY